MNNKMKCSNCGAKAEYSYSSMSWYCPVCTEKAERAKKIQYEIENPIKTYRITNRQTKETITLEARVAQEACRICGWNISVCYIKILGQ